jgi:hypothetical protein
VAVRRDWAEIMSASVDTALFRLRAFESDWLVPLLESPTSPVKSLLLAEAKSWVALGQIVGYFAAAPIAEPMARHPSDEFNPLFVELARSADTMDPGDFGYHLAVAQDDLTPESMTLTA